MAKWSAERRLLFEIRKDEKARAEAGMRPHVKDTSDPWSDVEWRVCEPGCVRHGL